jgi:hypothetical protein
VDVINKIEFSAKNLTSNAGLFLLLQHARRNQIFDLIDHDLVFKTQSTNRIKMNHIKTMLCDNFVGIDKLERLKLLQGDPLITTFDIAIKEPETVSRFLGNFSYKTTQRLREINFKVLRKLLRRHQHKSITIDMDSSLVNVEGHQEETAKGYNPKKPCNPCYNIQFAFCDELKAYLTGYVRSGDTYTANGAAGMLQEIIAHLKEEDLEIIFRMVSGYFDEDILETIESLGCRYVIKGKAYPTLVARITDPDLIFDTGEEGREITELVTTLNTWEKDRRFIVRRVLKDEKDRAQLFFLEGEAFTYSFFVTNTDLSPEEIVDFYQKRGNCENYIKEAKYDMAVGHLLLKSFWANEAIFQLMMLAYNLFLLFKMDMVKTTEYRQQIKTFRLKYVFLAGKIIRTARSVVMKLSDRYPFQEMYEQSLSG